MANNLTDQVRNIAQVTTAVAQGDLSQKITVEAKGEVAALADTINTMADTLRAFADEVTRVAREVGTEGKLGGQAEVPGVAGTWKDLTDSVNCMAVEPDRPGAQHRPGRDRPSPRATCRRRSPSRPRARSPRSRTRSTRWSTRCASFADEVTRVAREVGTEGKLGGQAEVPGVAGTWKDLTDNVNLMAAQPDRPGAQHRPGHDRGRQGRPVAEDHASTPRARSSSSKNTINTMVDQLRVVRRRGHARRARGRHRGQARRPGRGAGRRRHLEGPDRQRQLHGRAT